MSKFTKGPWKYMNDGTIRACRPNSALLINIIYLVGFKNFKEVLGEKTAYEMTDADGRLAAAAPEMYKLLSDLVKELRAYDPVEDLYSLMIEAEELLARIDGEGSKS